MRPVPCQSISCPTFPRPRVSWPRVVSFVRVTLGPNTSFFSDSKTNSNWHVQIGGGGRRLSKSGALLASSPLPPLGESTMDRSLHGYSGAGNKKYTIPQLDPRGGRGRVPALGMACSFHVRSSARRSVSRTCICETCSGSQVDFNPPPSTLPVRDRRKAQLVAVLA
ncbi:hypothetical protein LX32DRAFT_18837 [Colletotrichum zoysiae]|uniref:Uncharacterized protein n=1 Tax=Colletotrichum zoysiae TaxID=1216348 RepID=A0AAD9HEB8_9PEZI|nr:hypothetical protein LX32DRAFT_18837 [Colletotrichum zoysiae]